MRATPFWVSLVLAPTLVGAALVMTEANFVSDSIKGDNSEVALGQLAVSKATGEPVRSFGHTLESDHSNAKTQADE